MTQDNLSHAKQPRYLLVTWMLLLLLGGLFLFASLSDLTSDVGTGIPSDHTAAFQNIAGMTWSAAQSSSPGATQYITLLEVAYAAHELVFALLFLLIVAIPFRRRALGLVGVLGADDSEYHLFADLWRARFKGADV